MLTRKKSVVSCFVIGALLCTLIPGGDAYGRSAETASHLELAAGVQDIRKASPEENTEKYTEDSNVVPTTAAARIAASSTTGGAAGFTASALEQAGKETALAVEAGVIPEAAEAAQQADEIAPELENKVLTTVDTYQNVRQEPSEDAEVVGRLYEGSAGEILENGDGWTKISSGGVEGWVHNDYVVSGEEAQDFAEESLEQVAVVTDEGVRVRAGASIDSTWIGVVNADEVYEIVPEESEEAAADEAETAAQAEEPEASGEAEPSDGEAGEDLEWVRILYDEDQEGYVCADYVTTEFELGEARSMEEIRAEEEARAEAEREASRRTEEAEASYDDEDDEPAVSASASDSGWVALGEFKITSYCGGACCNGKWAGTTATGASPKEGRTIAVAPWVIPYGSEVMIEGLGVFVAEDTGGFANRNAHQIDLFVADHDRANSWGVQYHQVYIRK